jgi:very-short-patch-repair endonuclease
MDILGMERDEKRTQFLARFGIEVLRFENEVVLNQREFVLEAIRAALRRRA